MPGTYVQVSTGDPWINGVSYRFTYDVDHVKLFGWNIPDELIPLAIRERQAKEQISQCVAKLENDPRLEVQGYEFYGRTFTINVIARDNPAPIALIVGGIIALAIIFGISLVISKVEAVVEEIGKTADKIGPVATNAIALSVFAAVGVGAFLLLKRNI